MLEYFFSATQGRWLVADKKTGELVAQFTAAVDITSHFMQEIIEHATEQCDCSDCEDGRMDAASDSADVLHDFPRQSWATGGFGDDF